MRDMGERYATKYLHKSEDIVKYCCMLAGVI